MSMTRTLGMLCAGGLTLAQLASPAPASACGGLFCDATQPVNQEAERIIFAKNDDGTVTAVVEIMYRGPAEKFAWVLPVPGTPDVNVSSTQALDALQQASNPLYRLNTVVEGTCKQEDFNRGAVAQGTSADSGANFEGSEGAEGGGVVVLASGNVGPYNFDVISVVGEVSMPAQLAVDWLMDNGYDLGEIGPGVLGSYLEDGMNLLAFKLDKNNLYNTLSAAGSYVGVVER